MSLLKFNLDESVDFSIFFTELGANNELHLVITEVGAFPVTPEIRSKAEELIRGAGDNMTHKLSIVAILMTMLRQVA
jgi:hypothetical protein